MTSVFPALKKFVLIGDSITEGGYANGGYVTLLSEWYRRRVDVVNRGFSGYNSFQLNAMVPILFPLADGPRKDIVMVSIFLGANDSALEGEPQHVPVDNYEANIKSIIDYFRLLNSDTKILLITPGQVNHESYPTRHNDSVSQYAERCRKIAKELDVLLVDIWQGENRIEFSDLDDGLHFAPSAGRKLFQEIQQVIDTHCPSLVPENLPRLFPDWRMVCGVSEEVALERLNASRW